MRTKEDAHDYRYFPDPDLPPLVIAQSWIEEVRSAMPELPSMMAARFQKEHGLPAHDASLLTQSRDFSAYFEATVQSCGEAKLAANWIMGELSRRLNAEGRSIHVSPVKPQTLGRLIARIADGTISNNGAKQVFDALWSGEQVSDDGEVQRRLHAESGEYEIRGADSTLEHHRASVDDLIDSLGLKQMSDTGELERILDEVLANNPKSVEEFRAGKEKAFNALVGQAMKASKGKANPAQVNGLLRKKLG
jgi:aspartyl-tRNA(Asn)/glutamyl-tRNA(Gln) amidotransferase subunit B